MGKWYRVGLYAPVLGLHLAEAFSRHGPAELGDFKVFGDGAHRLVSDISKAIGSEGEEIEGLQENLPTPHEAKVLSGVSEMEDEPESLLETDEYGEDSASHELDDENYEYEDDAHEDEEEEGSFLESHEDEHSEEEFEEEDHSGADNETNEDGDSEPSFIEGFLDHEDEEDFVGDEQQSQFADGEEVHEHQQDAADPYSEGGSADSEKASYLEEEADAEADDANVEDSAHEDDEELPVSGAFIQLGVKKVVRHHDHRRTASPSFAQTHLSAPEFSDQGAAENEMLREAGEFQAIPGEPNSAEKATVEAVSGTGELGSEGDNTGTPGGSEDVTPEEHQDEAYNGPADPMIKYGGDASDDVVIDEAEQPGLEEPSPETLQSRAEEAGMEQDEMPPTTEDELASDLQESFPTVSDAHPHSVQPRHVEQDIRMTETLRTEAKAEPKKDDASFASCTLALALAGLTFLWL